MLRLLLPFIGNNCYSDCYSYTAKNHPDDDNCDFQDDNFDTNNDKHKDNDVNHKDKNLNINSTYNINSSLNNGSNDKD